MRAVIYARYSDEDLQREESIEDQVRMCKERIAKEGWTYLNYYDDPGISGASILLRPAVQSLVQAALAGQFDVVVFEDLDRLSRDQEDTAGVYKRLQFAGVEMFSLADGFITELHVGLKSTMNSIQLKQTAQKVRRGQRGRVEAGKIPGGNAYGYTVVRQFDSEGEPIRGDREINRDQAQIVIRIMEEYAAGHSPRAICGRLNKEGIAGPTGKAWDQSTLNGNRRRGNGILNNELYIGTIVYNRQRYIKNPDTGKRVARLNPEEEWVRKDVPELRIVSDELWSAVKSRQKKLEVKKPEFWKRKRPKNLFSYLLKCGECGSGFSMVSATHVGCTGARNKGVCGNRRTMDRKKLEQKVLGTLQTHLMNPALCKEFCNEYTRHINRVRMEHNAALNSYRSEYEKIERERKKLVQSILDGVPGEVLKDDAHRIQNRKEELERLLETTNEAPPLFHPNMALRYHEEVQRLIESLNEEDHRAEAAELIRSLIDKVVLSPAEDEGSLVVDLHGDLAGILTMATGKARKDIVAQLDATLRDTLEKPQDSAVIQASQVSQVKLVAGDCNQSILRKKQDQLGAGRGFEPLTFRL